MLSGKLCNAFGEVLQKERQLARQLIFDFNNLQIEIAVGNYCIILIKITDD